MAAARREPITTHVLDQTSGRPAGNLAVTLEWLRDADKPSRAVFSARTAADSGRIEEWQSSQRDVKLGTEGEAGGKTITTETLRSFVDQLGVEGVPTAQWRLRFATKDYWKASDMYSFYPVVEVTFETDFKGTADHWHVPVLLGPYGYTTYRGT